MKKLWSITRFELKQNVFRKSFLLALLSIPFMVSLTIGMGMYMESTQENNAPVGYIDRSGVLETALPGPGDIPMIAYANETQARLALDHGEIQAIFAISPDYLQSGDVQLLFNKPPGRDAVGQFYDFMQTNLLDVYASGDVAETYDFIVNQNRLLPLWPLAVLEGRVAGYNMAGQKTCYEGGTNMSSLKYFGIPIVSIGLANAKDDPTLEIAVKQDTENNVYKKLVLKNNIIVGLTLVNCIDRAGILFSLMKNQVNVKKFKGELLRDDFGWAVLPVALQRKMSVIQ